MASQCQRARAEATDEERGHDPDAQPPPTPSRDRRSQEFLFRARTGWRGACAEELLAQPAPAPEHVVGAARAAPQCGRMSESRAMSMHLGGFVQPAREQGPR